MTFTVTFTGTRDGMSDHQLSELVRVLIKLGDPASAWPAPTTFIHGACMGADTQFGEVVWDLRSRHDGITVEVFPSTSLRTRRRADSDYEHPPAPPLVRDQSMVDRADLVIAAPRTPVEQTRSGTWTTVRMARRRLLPIILLAPTPADLTKITGRCTHVALPA